ncbi:MAG: flavin reductase (DIM6/NTAB) family NADH-FMN oxidoreductase RutF [Gammaproteobacteria bacterium]|jgi:flavin reductase (DIM6/NTAB) family NADH-FMN oxidoreductase RutF
MSGDSSSTSPVDVKTFWQTLGERAIGMTVVTASDENGPAGFLGLSATHVTASPPTMLVSIDRKTSALSAVISSGHFAVNFLDAGANDVADAFSGKAGLSGSERFRDGEWTTMVSGAPIHVHALGAFECRVEKIIDHGEIAIVIGAVVGAHTVGKGQPLIFFRGKTMTG